MGSLRKRNGICNAQVRITGWRSFNKTFSKKTDAEDWCKVTEAKIQSLPIPEINQKHLCLKDLFERYLDEIGYLKSSYILRYKLGMISRSWLGNIKIDLLSNRKDLAEYIASIPENFSSSYHEIIPISIKKNKNIKELISLIDSNLTGQKNNTSFSSYIPKDRNFYIEEYIREASINFLNLEIPYNIHINLEKIHERKNNFFISAEIITNKKSHMNIIIGKRASMLKKINIYARKLIKAYLKKDIFLELVVRYKENWKEAKDFLDTYK